jgi:protease-4
VCRVRILVLLAYNVLRLLTWPLRVLFWRLRYRSTRWVRLRLRGKLDELPVARRGVAQLLGRLRGEPRSVLAVRKLVQRLARDPKSEGLLLHLEHVSASYATLASLHHELTSLRQAGKKVVCYLPVGADQKELFIASAADRVLAMPHAGFTALGPLAARTYLAPLLQRLGLDMLVTAEGRYKTAAETLTRDSMSEPEREQLQAIVQTLLTDWKAALATRAPLGASGAQRLLQQGVFGGRQAVELGAVDGCAYEDELAAELSLGPRETVLDDRAYLDRSAPRPRCFVPLTARRRVALVRLVGPIGVRSNPRGIDLHGTTSLLRTLGRARNVAGVILYVDSPGGSALVSELLHREIKQLDARKPVVTWMGGVAASGGYYLAAATRAIIARPTTLTGSIGVVSLRPVARRLTELLHIRREVVGLTPHADLYSLVRPPSAEEHALLSAESARFYERFLEIVAAGRSRSRAEIAELAQGRVWSGRDAHACGLVDALGGYAEARDTLDRLLVTKDVASEPWLVNPPLRDVISPLPERSRESWAGELAHARELLSFALDSERILAYAWDLPAL